MGDPRPGQIVDNIFLSVQQIRILGDQVGKKGDLFIRKDTEPFFKRSIIAGDDDIMNGFAQARVDFDSTGQADGEVIIEALMAPSYIYGIAGEDLKPGASLSLFTSAVAGFGAFQTFRAAPGADLAGFKVVGRFSRLATDSAGNNDAVAGNTIIVKLGVL